MTSKLRNLWDSDEGEQHEDAAQRNRVKPRLFDSSDSEEERTNGSWKEIMDYKSLYLCEVQKRKSAEAEIVELTRELASLKELVRQMHAGEEKEGIKGGIGQPVCTDSTEWEVLAREERERRRHKIRTMQAKQRMQVASKRVPGTIKSDEVLPSMQSTAIGVDSASAVGLPPMEGSLLGAATCSGAAAAAAAAVDSGRNSSGHYLDSSDSSGGEESVGPGSSSPPLLGAPAPAATEVADQTAAATEELDPEEAKWKELAAQERQRKALARRSVRTVRRVGAAEVGEGTGTLEDASGAGAVGGVGRARPALRQRHLRGSQLHSVIVIGGLQGQDGGATAAMVSTSTQLASIAYGSADAAVATGLRGGAGARSDSDWDSDSSDRSRAGDDSSAQQPAAAPASQEAPHLTSAEEAVMDARLRRWASARNLPALLCAVPDVLQHSANAVKMAGLDSALAPLRQAISSSGATINSVDCASHWPVTRMAYMKVIRCCHPDKHMDLPPRGAAFLELQKVFTALCEAYKAHKGAVGSS